MDSGGAWETLMGCVAGRKAPQSVCLPHLQALQVAEEVKVLSSPARASLGRYI
jgi:hypothetical protein